MHKQSSKKDFLKIIKMKIRLHQGPVFNVYKPNYENAKQNSFYRGAIAWNDLTAENRNREFTNSMIWIIGDRFI